MTTHWPEVGDQLPKLGNAFTRGCGRLVLALYEWRITGDLPNRAKMLLAVAPHTSIWDFFFLFSAMLAIGFHSHWLMTRAFFRWPLGPIVRSLGATPVDKGRSQDLVSQMTAEFQCHDRYLLALAPEGTRRKVPEWKSGFYFIAHGAGIPILPISIDFSRRLIRFGTPFEPSGDFDEDLPKLKAFFENSVPKHPEKY